MPPDANPRNAGILDEHFLMGVSVELGDRFNECGIAKEEVTIAPP